MRITASRGIALYVGALLGPGLLVLPGLAAALAGPASILAWTGLLALSGLIALVFAAFGIAARTPPARGSGRESGGVAGYVRLGLGERAGRAVGWCFLAGIGTGAPLVCFMGAGYVSDLLGAGDLVTGVVSAVLLVAIGGAAPHSADANWTPFAPHGWTAVGSAATVLMFSFVGWEAIAPLTGTFADPRRDLPRVIGAAFVITAVIYLALATVTVAALGDGAGSDVPISALLSLGLGAGAGPVVAAVSAVILTLGTTNAYLTGGMQMVRRPGAFMAAMVAVEVLLLALIGTGAVSVASAVTVPTAFFLVVYLGCMVSAARALHGWVRPVAAVAAVAVAVVLAFAGWAVLPAALVTAAAFLMRRTAGRGGEGAAPGRAHDGERHAPV
ncbi:amino acid permease [Actinoplanes sp. NPDC051494]|uniref:amino acid permease n=1 Tax=Actinoplanes sp. NPDC051494 TaxID=3363907 RepID=UPI0037966CBD